jgi:hypothetical protein
MRSVMTGRENITVRKAEQVKMGTGINYIEIVQSRKKNGNDEVDKN